MTAVPPGPAFSDPFASEPVISSEQELSDYMSRLLKRRQAERRAGAGAPAPDPVAKRVGEQVKTWRHQQGLGRLALAQRAGIHPLYLVALENGQLRREQISVAVKARLALALEWPLDEWSLLP